MVKGEFPNKKGYVYKLGYFQYRTAIAKFSFEQKWCVNRYAKQIRFYAPML